MCYISSVYNSHCFLEFCFIVVFVFYLKICITRIQITFYWIWPSGVSLFSSAGGPKNVAVTGKWHFSCPGYAMCCHLMLCWPGSLGHKDTVRLVPQIHLSWAPSILDESRGTSTLGTGKTNKSGPQKKPDLNTFTDAISRQLQSHFILLSAYWSENLTALSVDDLFFSFCNASWSSLHITIMCLHQTQSISHFAIQPRSTNGPS